MNTIGFPRTHPILFSLKYSSKHHNLIRETSRFRFYCTPVESQSIDVAKPKYKAGPFDGLLLNFFRQKMVEEIGWDSKKPGYDGLIEVANRLMLKGKTNLETEKSAVRVLKSLFPPFILVLFKTLIAPIGGGKVASMMVVADGTCSVNSVDLPDGSTCSSGVFVEKCKYLEESKCIGICINTCKLPTQTFFKDCMGVPLHMEPNFTDYSCQFKFGISAPEPNNDEVLREPCLEICPNANRRKELGSRNLVSKCPQV